MDGRNGEMDLPTFEHPDMVGCRCFHQDDLHTGHMLGVLMQEGRKRTFNHPYRRHHLEQRDLPAP